MLVFQCVRIILMAIDGCNSLGLNETLGVLLGRL